MPIADDSVERDNRYSLFYPLRSNILNLQHNIILLCRRLLI